MKKNVRLVLLFALIAVMVVMTAVFASAATDVGTAADLKTALAAGGEINLTADIDLSTAVTIDKNVTINGNDHKITMGATKFTVTGSLTLNDVTIEGSTYILTPSKGGAIIINSGVYTGGIQMAGGNSGVEPATLVINGGEFAPGTGHLIHANQRNNIITINDGTFNNGASSNMLLRISDGTNNIITINGGTFSASGAGHIVQKNGVSTFTVKGGTFTHTGAGSIIQYASSVGAYSITGGTFTHEGEGSVVLLASGVPAWIDTTNMTASGTVVSGTYTEADLSEKLFQVNGVAYTLNEALAAVANGGTITLLGDPSYPVIVDVDKTFTLVGCEATITQKIYVSKGNVTISGLKSNVPSTHGVISAGVSVVSLENCVITASIPVYCYGGSLTVTDCDLTSSSGGQVVVFNPQNNPAGTATITGSTLIGDGSGGCVSVAANCTSVTVTDCTLYGYRGLRLYAAADGATFTVQGCTWRPQYTGTASSISDYCTNGVPVVTYTGVTNCTFNITDCDIDNTVYGTGELREPLGVKSGSSIITDTADMQNKWNLTDCDIVWVSSAAAFPAIKNNPVTLTNCTVDYTGGGYMFGVSSANTWTITGGTYTHNGDGIMVRISDGGMTFAVDGATFVNNSNINMFVLNNGTLDIANATLTQNGTATMIELGSGSYKGPMTIADSTLNSGSNLSINVQGAHPVTLNNVEVGSITIADSYTIPVNLIDVTVDTLTDPSGVAVITTVRVKYFEIGGVQYTWEDAMAALKNGDTVTVVGPVDWALEIDTDKSFTLVSNEFVLPGIVVTAGTVTMQNVKVTAANAAVGVNIAEGATVTLGTGCVITATATSLDGVVNYGTLTINGATVSTAGGSDAIDNKGVLNFLSGSSSTSAGGDALFSQSADFTLTLGEITLTSTGSGSALNCHNDVVLNGTTLNAGAGTGCALKVQSSSFGLINNATATGTLLTNSSDLTIKNGTFSTGTYAHATGVKPVVFINSAGTITIEGGTFSNVGTVAPDFATDVEAASSSVICDNDGNGNIVITGGTFTLTGEGAAIFLRNYKTFSISNATINTDAIGIYAGRAGQSAATVTNTTINGGEVGIWYGIAKAMTVTDSTIKDCATAILTTYNAASLTVDGGKIATGETGVVLQNSKDGFIPVFENVMFIDQNETTSTVFGDTTATLTDCIVLSAIGKEIGAGTEASVTDQAPTVKYNTVRYYVWMVRDGEAEGDIDGAGVRVTAGQEGIRFTGYATVVADAEYGILIAPVDYVTAAGAFTKDALDKWAAANDVAVAYQMVKAVNSLEIVGETATFSVALINIQSGNYTRGFAAVAYVKVGENISYSDYDSQSNVRSMAQVAEAALADEVAAADVAAGYIYLNEETGKYSKYTLDQRTVLKGYVA